MTMTEQEAGGKRFGKAPQSFQVQATVLLCTILLLSACISPAPPAPPATPPVQSEPDIMELIRTNDTAGLQALFRGRELVNAVDANGNYPLHTAVSQGSARMVEILLAMGANPDVQDTDGRTPLRLALDKSDLASAKLLVDRNTNLFLADSNSVSPLDIAIAKEQTGQVITRGNLAQRNSLGQSPLHVAVERMSLPAVRAILLMSPAVNETDKDGKTALDTAFLYPNNPASAAIAEQLVLNNGTSAFEDFAYFMRAIRDTNPARVRFAEGASVLHEAVRFDHRGFLQFFLDKAVPVDTRNAAGASALHDAMRLGHLEAAAILLARRADSNALDGNGNTPLHLALGSSRSQQAVSLLLERGADPAIKDKAGNTALHLAVRQGLPLSLIQQFISRNVGIDGTNSEGDSALLLAMRLGRFQLVETLVKGGAGIFTRNTRGETPLSIAFRSGREALQTLLQPASKDIRDDKGETPFHFALRIETSLDNLRVLHELGFNPSVRNNDGDTALHLACSFNRRVQGEFLLGIGADPFILNTSNASPLSIALGRGAEPLAWFFTPTVMVMRDASGNTMLHHAAMAGLSDGIVFLVNKGAQIDARNNDGRTPLMAALRNDATAVVRSLLALGAASALRDASGATALHLAVFWSARNSIDILSQVSATIDPRDFTGKTPLREAIERGNLNMVNFLISKKADPLARDVSGETPLHAAARNTDIRLLQSLAELPIRLDIRDDSGVTPLLRAVLSENIRAANLLAGKGASIHARDAAGESPLGFALKRDPALLRAILNPASIQSSDAEGKSVLRVCVDARAGTELIELVLSVNPPVDDRDSQGRTPLLMAIETGQWTVAALLVANGADPFIRDAKGRSPATAALAGNAPAITSLFAFNPDISDTQGDTALHYAAAAGQDKAAVQLLELGATAKAVNVAGETPQQVAIRRGHQILADLFAGIN